MCQSAQWLSHRVSLILADTAASQRTRGLGGYWVTPTGRLLLGDSYWVTPTGRLLLGDYWVTPTGWLLLGDSYWETTG